MTTPASVTDAAPVAAPGPSDHRGSPIPTFGMIATRFMELRKRRGLMITLILVTVGIPAVFLAIRLLLHGISPKTYGPAGGYDIYTAMVSGVLYIFGFIVAATLGAAAGSGDLSEGMFRHEVVTGRSRLALYLARIPAGLAVIVPLVAIGFTVVCTVCVFAAPKDLNFNGVSVPGNLSKPGLESWAAGHAGKVICDFDYRSGPSLTFEAVANSLHCGPPDVGPKAVQAPGGLPQPSPAQVADAARHVAALDYPEYHRLFLYPSNSLILKSGLWLELEALIGFTVGLGLASLTGQRTLTVVLMIVLEVVLTPILSRVHIPHMINLQRAVVGLATAHLTPAGLRVLGGGGGGAGGAGNELVPETVTTAVCVIIAWLVGWSILGAWRMMKRDA